MIVFRGRVDSTFLVVAFAEAFVVFLVVTISLILHY
jgi:hypothetical protein